MTIKPYLATGAATCAAAIIGGAGTAVGSQWYAELDRPAWQPPGEVIGAVWTGLYVSIAGATGRAAATASPERRRRIAALLGVNLAINAAWPWVFFRAGRPLLGVAVIGALEASTIALTREVGKADRVAGAALAPYLGWNLFAMTLNATIARRNPRRSR
ncbi:MAG: TspO/MBR family protein [Streptosporangiaceae bacterium]